MPSERVGVSMADSRGIDLYADFASLWRIDFDGFDAKRRFGFPSNGRSTRDDLAHARHFPSLNVNTTGDSQGII